MGATKDHILAKNSEIYKETKALSVEKMKALQGWNEKLHDKVDMFNDNMSAVNRSCDEALSEISAAAMQARDRIDQEETRLVANVTQRRDDKNVKISGVISNCREFSSQIKRLETEVENIELIG